VVSVNSNPVLLPPAFSEASAKPLLLRRLRLYSGRLLVLKVSLVPLLLLLEAVCLGSQLNLHLPLVASVSLPPSLRRVCLVSLSQSVSLVRRLLSVRPLPHSVPPNPQASDSPRSLLALGASPPPPSLPRSERRQPPLAAPRVSASPRPPRLARPPRLLGSAGASGALAGARSAARRGLRAKNSRLFSRRVASAPE